MDLALNVKESKSGRFLSMLVFSSSSNVFAFQNGRMVLGGSLCIVLFARF